MELSVYYRVTPAGNGKPRPSWFSKAAALRSLRAALDRVPGARLTYVADSGVPAELAELVGGSEVVRVRGGTAAASFRRLLDVAVPRAATDPGGLVWFAEDDYVYRPDALVRLLEAAAALPEADYFGLYTPDNADWHARTPSQPGRRGPAARWDVAGTSWRRTWDSTSTYGLRARVLHQDARLLRLWTHSGGPWDHTTVSAVQGVPPYDLRRLYGDLFLRWSRASAGRVLTRPLLRTVADLSALGRARTWVAPVRDLATHVEPGHLSPAEDWAAYVS